MRAGDDRLSSCIHNCTVKLYNYCGGVTPGLDSDSSMPHPPSLAYYCSNGEEGVGVMGVYTGGGGHRWLLYKVYFVSQVALPESIFRILNMHARVGSIALLINSTSPFNLLHFYPCQLNIVFIYSSLEHIIFEICPY